MGKKCSKSPVHFSRALDFFFFSLSFVVGQVEEAEVGGSGMGREALGRKCETVFCAVWDMLVLSPDIKG